MKLPFKINDRERRVLVIGAVIAALILIYRVSGWYGDINNDVRDLTEAKTMMLQKQQRNISEIDLLASKLEKFRTNAVKQNRALLKGDKPPVAAAELQSIVKGMLSDLNVEMRSERTLSTKDMGYYLGVPVEIGFISDTEKLKSLLYRLKRYSLLLHVSELKVRVTNINNPVNTYVTLVITGFIKKPSDGASAGKG